MTERLRLLTARDAAELVGPSTETIVRRYRVGEIPGFRLASNVLRFDRAEVEAWLERCRQPECSRLYERLNRSHSPRGVRCFHWPRT